MIAEMSDTVTPQGIVGLCRFLDSPFEEILRARPRLVAVLANVRDPGNAGTVLRCADAAGADAVVFTDASVDPYNPKAVRASVGSLFHLPVATGVPVEEAVGGLKEAGARVLAADGAGERDLDAELDDGVLGAPTAWIFGNEAWGLPEATRALADEVVRVPIHGRAESLNLATAAAVCLYASARAQRAPTGCRSVTRDLVGFAPTRGPGGGAGMDVRTAGARAAAADAHAPGRRCRAPAGTIAGSRHGREHGAHDPCEAPAGARRCTQTICPTAWSWPTRRAGSSASTRRRPASPPSAPRTPSAGGWSARCR